MKEHEDLKQIVRNKYSEIALQDKTMNESSCCGSGCCTTEAYTIMAEDYSQLEGYNPEADLRLGCGLPTSFANIKKVAVVIELGSVTGNDVIIARHHTGYSENVMRIDFTPVMIVRS